VLIFKIEVFATALLAIHKKNVYRDGQNKKEKMTNNDL
jgi:hypothetical protein